MTAEQNESPLIPPPSIVRERIAQNLRERRLLRSQLRISEATAEAQDRGAIRTPLVGNRLTLDPALAGDGR